MTEIRAELVRRVVRPAASLFGVTVRERLVEDVTVDADFWDGFE